MPEIRKLLFEGKYLEAEAMTNQYMTNQGGGFNGAYDSSYQTLGDLHLEFEAQLKVIAIGGTISGGDDTLRIEKADEVLPQSHAGEVHLLPALPKAWASGRVTGLRARGGFEVDVAWKDGALTEATFRSKLGGTAKVRHGQKILDVQVPQGKTVVLTGEDFRR